MIRGKHIVVGVTGGIAAYKVCYLVRELRKGGADVKVVMTDAAAKFVSPLTFSALSGHEVATDLWATNQAGDSDIATRHIDLAMWADAFVIAPASANTIAKLTYGLSDNLLTIIALAARCPILIAPTMDADMYINPITQQNTGRLQERGYGIIPPAEGELASGLKGPGRLPEIQVILDSLEQTLNGSHLDFKGRSILVTAGPTYEPIDPVRFIGNRSSGKMGFAIARAAAQRGASVTLIAGPVMLETPRNVRRIDVGTAAEMHDAVLSHVSRVDAVIMAAAVADYAPAAPAKNKIKKQAASLSVELAGTPDILLALGAKKSKKTILVGFALETENELQNAQAKLKKKNLDLIVLNSLKDKGAGFGGDTNIVTLVPRSGKSQKLPLMSKFDTANEILNRLKKLF